MHIYRRGGSPDLTQSIQGMRQPERLAARDVRGTLEKRILGSVWL